MTTWSLKSLIKGTSTIYEIEVLLHDYLLLAFYVFCNAGSIWDNIVSEEL